MCLSIYPVDAIDKADIPTTKDGKFLIGYKVLVDRPWKNQSHIPLKSVYNNTRWAFYQDKDRKLTHRSSRKSTKLTQTELNSEQVYMGFHFFVNIEDAREEKAYLDGGPKNPITHRVVTCHIPIECFVAQGTFLNCRSFVATKTKLMKLYSSAKSRKRKDK